MSALCVLYGSEKGGQKPNETASPVITVVKSGVAIAEHC